ncbi:energy-coupling factor transporter transmembrane component T [Trueperella abortisuis]|uniref:energy-coupling factor transporter transmembrane component T n=1 Tax=Trueperella abortisuis TaxID=445930 RepID=UPI0028930A14|nr:energy-coupling factor transporter transmembrane component T [Trueperella abortisuis]
MSFLEDRVGTLSVRSEQPSPTRVGASSPHPDPRTVLLAVLVINVLAMSRRAGFAGCLVAFCVAWAAVWTLGRVRAAVKIGLAQAILVALAIVPSSLWPNGFTAFVTVACMWLAQFGATVAIAYYAIAVIAPGELVAAMRQLRCPVAVVVPLTVMLRFIPLVVSEYRGIREAMTLRGLAPGWRVLIHPLDYLEMVLVPLLMSCSRTADEMTAAGMVRGLGSHVRPTTMRRLHMRPSDVAWLVILAALIGVGPFVRHIDLLGIGAA